LNMSRASGLILILCGLAVGAYGMRPDSNMGEPEMARQTGVPKNSPSDDRAGGTAGTPARVVPLETNFSTPVVVTLTQHPNVPPLAPAATIVKDRDTLVRELQKELRRVGCFDGAVNGAWTLSTRGAMKAFMDRVNATLPVHEPDYILYVMLQSQREKVCDKPCPSGQGLSEDGRCLPNVVLAKATKKKSTPVAVSPSKGMPLPGEKTPPIISWSTTRTTTAQTPTTPLAQAPLEGRMALVGASAQEILPTTTEPPAPVPRIQTPSRPRSVESPKRDADWSRTAFRGDNH
jgi:hypothetical protein